MMMKILALLVLAVTLSSAVAAEDFPAGVEFYDVEIREVSWIDRLFGGDALAIVTGSSTYVPGAIAEVTVQAPVPCTAMYAYFGIRYPDGREEVRPLSITIPRCSSALFKTSLKVPDAVGTYRLFVDFKDANFASVGGEEAVLVVAQPGSTCPTGYCSSWTTFQKIDGGRIEARACYHFAAGTCTQSVAQTYRTVCDRGFDLQNGRCVARSTIPVCGDGTVQAGEACDRGQENGACPSSCSSLCGVNTCAALPVPVGPEPPAGGGAESSRGIPAAWWLVGAGAAIVAGGLYVGGKKR